MIPIHPQKDMIHPRFVLLVLLTIATASSSLGQHFVGFQTNNYSGIYGIDLQPASIAGSLVRFDANVGGFSLNAQNNYVGLLSSEILNGGFEGLNDSTQSRLLPQVLNGNDKSVIFNQDIQLPSIMFAFSPKHSIAITSRFRTFFNLDQVGEPAAVFAYNGLDVPEQFGLRYNNDRLSLDAMSYLELGLGYARELFDDGPNYLKAGMRLKYNVGVAATYFYANEVDYSLDNADILNIHQGDFSYAHSSVIGNIDPGFNLGQLGDREPGNRGLGLDFGFVYEFRPDHETFFSGEGEYRNERNDLAKYKYRLGFSVLDIGNISFAQDSNSGDFSGEVIGFDLRALRGGQDVSYFDSVLSSEFDMITAPDRFKMALPTVISLQADIRFSRNLYLNVSPQLAIKRPLQENRVHAASWLTVTPRFESRWLGLGVPISFTDYHGWTVGVAASLGPLVLGTGNLTDIWLRNDTRGANVYFGLHTPMPYSRPKDRDKDGIPDKQDACPKEAGPASNQGCPESTEEPAPEIAAAEPETDKPKQTERETAPPVEIDPDTEPPSPVEPSPVEPEPETVPNPVESPETETAPDPATPDPDAPTETAETPAPAPATPTEPVVSPEELQRQAEEERQLQVAEERQKQIDEAKARAEAKKKLAEEAKRKREQAIAEAKAEEERKKQAEIDLKKKEAEELKAFIANLEEEETKERERRRIEREERIAQGLPPLESERPTRVVKPAGPTIIPFDELKSDYSGEFAQYMPYADTDKDGVPNIEDKCPETPGEVRFLGCPEGDQRGLPASAKVDENFELDAYDRVFFESGKDYLDGRARIAINQLARLMQEQPAIKVMIVGHADEIGPANSNDGLSMRRCKAVEAFLSSRGIAEDRIAIEFYGERLPVAPNDSESGRQKNRRVELVLFSD